MVAVAAAVLVGCKSNPQPAIGIQESNWPNKLDAVRYEYAPELLGSATYLGLNRSGYVSYSFSSEPHTGSGGETAVKQWNIPPEEASKLLDALVEKRILDLTLEGQTKYPSNAFRLSADGWNKVVIPKVVPDEIWQLWLPLLIEADPYRWNKASQPLSQN